MRYLLSADKEKLELIDKIFHGISKEELKTLSEREEIVARLKGQPLPPGPASQLIQEFQMMNNEIQMLKGDIQTLRVEHEALRNDFTLLLKRLSNPLNHSVNGMTDYDLQNMKSRYGIYN